MSILLVEDNASISKALAYSLNANQYETRVCAGIREAKTVLEAGDVELIILDVTLPDGNGFDFYREHVSTLKIPTIFLTARDDEDDVVHGLELGAEEYITKPFGTRELLTRIQRILRKNDSKKVIIGDTIYDYDKMTLTVRDREIELSSLERKLVHLLFTNRNQVVSRNSILDHIWEWTGNDVDDHTVTVYMKRIREKMNSDLIITVKGIGYRIDG